MYVYNLGCYRCRGYAAMELLFHSLGIVVLIEVCNGGNRMYNVRVLPVMFRSRMYNRLLNLIS